MPFGLPELTTAINPTPMFDKSIYGNIQNIFKGSQYTVRIYNGNSSQAIVGLLRNNLKIDMAATWEPTNILGELTSNTQIINSLFKATQFGGLADPTKYGLSSKKVYSHSGYLEIGVEFRVVDWYAEGETLKSAFALLSHVTPVKRDEIGIPGIKEVISAIKGAYSLVLERYGEEGAASFSNLVEAVQNITGNEKIKEGLQEIKEIAGKTLKAAGRGAESFLGDSQFFVAAASPLPVRLKIGNYLERPDMVIENVGVDFSRECTNVGPLYADFDVKLSSRTAVLLDASGESADPDYGFKALSGRSRILRNAGEQPNLSSFSSGVSQ